MDGESLVSGPHVIGRQVICHHDAAPVAVTRQVQQNWVLPDQHLGPVKRRLLLKGGKDGLIKIFAPHCRVWGRKVTDMDYQRRQGKNGQGHNRTHLSITLALGAVRSSQCGDSMQEVNARPSRVSKKFV